MLTIDIDLQRSQQTSCTSPESTFFYVFDFDKGLFFIEGLFDFGKGLFFIEGLCFDLS